MLCNRLSLGRAALVTARRGTGEENHEGRQQRGRGEPVKAALNRAGGLFQKTEGSGRNKAAEVADGVDQRNDCCGDACIQIALRDWLEQRRSGLEANRCETDGYKSEDRPADG